jgi:hypothetical protein
MGAGAGTLRAKGASIVAVSVVVPTVVTLTATFVHGQAHVHLQQLVLQEVELARDMHQHQLFKEVSRRGELAHVFGKQGGLVQVQAVVC